MKHFRKILRTLTVLRVMPVRLSISGSVSLSRQYKRLTFSCKFMVILSLFSLLQNWSR